MAIVTGSWILDLVLLLSSAVGALYLYFLHVNTYWKKRNVAFIPPSFPMGSMPGAAIRNSLGDELKKLYNALPDEKYIGTWTAMRPILMVRDPEIIKNIFVKDHSSFRDRGIYVNEKAEPLAAHLFSIGGPKWKMLRNKLSPTFTSGKMKMMYPTLVECSKELDEFLAKPASKGEVVEVKDIMARFTTDIISSCAFGIQTNSLKDPKAIFREMGRKFFQPDLNIIIRNMLVVFVPKIAEVFKITVIRKEVSEFFLNAVKETMDFRKSTNTKRNDFMQLLIQLTEKGTIEELDDMQPDKRTGDTTRITFLEAAAQAFVFFAAGFETSSTTAQFALYELAKHQDLQDRVRQEILRVLAKHNGEMTYEAVQEMDYLQRVIDETLRMYPPVPILQRECNLTYQVPNTDLVIDKGTLVNIPIYGIQMDHKHYPEPERFDPERFTEEGKATRHHYAYLPFGEGPRNCIGMRFGLMQTKVGLITFLNNYRLEVAKETPIPLKLDKTSFILSPEGGMHLKISKLK